MGMYATIRGEEVKLSGLLCEAAASSGCDIDSGVCIVIHDAVPAFTHALLDSINRFKVTTENCYQDALMLSKAARVIALLLEHMNLDRGQDIVFA